MTEFSDVKSDIMERISQEVAEGGQGDEPNEGTYHKKDKDGSYTKDDKYSKYIG